MTPMLGIMASQISGHLWAPEGAYDSLATVTLSATTTSITFAGIPSGYKHLQVRAISRATAVDTGRTVFMRFNSDSATNYNWHYLRGDGASATAGASTSDSSIGNVIMGTAASSTASAFGVAVIDILDYADTNKYKTIRSLTGNSQNTTTDNYAQLTSGAWRSTAAVSSITFNVNSSGDFTQYSSFALYGCK